MAWDTAETRRRIKRAATAEFAQYGPDGTAIERIAKRAGVNKERVYNYFGDKRALFAAVLRGDYAGRVYDYHRERPELIRLLRWEALSYDGEVPDETLRAEYYECKSEAVTKGQSAGTITADIDAPHLMLLVLSVAGWWSAVPQVARMLCGPLSEQEHVKRRAAVVTAVRRLAAPGSTPQLG